MVSCTPQHATPSQEVLALMSRILGFTPDEQRRIGLAQSRRGLFGAVAGLLGGGGDGAGGSGAAKEGLAGQWVDFLLAQVTLMAKVDRLASAAVWTLEA